jgi:sugar phosphate isomerase/epimerase
MTMSRPIVLAALTVKELAPHEQVSAAADAGYDCVGLRLIRVGDQTLPPFDERETARRLADRGVRVFDVEVFRLAPETKVAEFEPVLAASARLRASELLVHGADPDEARLTETFGRLCDLAAKFGLSANLEPMPWVDVSTVAHAKRILDQAGRRNSALLVDAIHFFRADNRLDELKDMPKERFRYVQLCDAPAERPSDMQETIRQARADRLFPGEGGLDLKGLLSALPRDLPVSLEIPVARKMEPLERAKQALAAARKFL